MLTDREKKIVIEALGAYKRVLRSKAKRMSNKYGYSDTSKSRMRVDLANTAMRKLTGGKL